MLRLFIATYICPQSVHICPHQLPLSNPMSQTATGHSSSSMMSVTVLSRLPHVVRTLQEMLWKYCPKCHFDFLCACTFAVPHSCDHRPKSARCSVESCQRRSAASPRKILQRGSFALCIFAAKHSCVPHRYQPAYIDDQPSPLPFQSNTT